MSDKLPMSQQGQANDKLMSCHGKEGFASKTSAMHWLSLRRKKRKWGTTKIYKCRYCHQWHAGGGNGGAND